MQAATSPLITALIKASHDFKPVTTTRTVKYGNTNFSYANVHDCIMATKDALLKNDIFLSFDTRCHEKEVAVKVVLRHSSGEMFSSEPITLSAKSSSATDIGAAITYARRYAIISALNLAVEEPDIEQIEGSKYEDFESRVIKYDPPSKPKPEPKPEPAPSSPSKIKVMRNDAAIENLMTTIRVLYQQSSEQLRASISNNLNFSWKDLTNMGLTELLEVKEAFNVK